jgi:hypothetical protein
MKCTNRGRFELLPEAVLLALNAAMSVAVGLQLEKYRSFLPGVAVIVLFRYSMRSGHWKLEI